MNFDNGVMLTEVFSYQQLAVSESRSYKKRL